MIPTVSIIVGDALEKLRELSNESVQCGVTSPPYWGLRDYGETGQLGLEKTPEQYVAKMVEVFREFRRVLRNDGTLWLNLGDSYCASPKGSMNGQDKSGLTSTQTQENSPTGIDKSKLLGLKPKDLIGIPWRVAFALQADGWWLRQDIIWAKPNPMPESVTDRCTKSHEYLFLLTKSSRYFYDAEAIKEEAEYREDARPFGEAGNNRHGDEGSTYDPKASWKGSDFHLGKTAEHQLGRSSKKRGEFNGKTNALVGREAFRAFTMTRNKRSVWTVATAPYPDAHFATYPPDLIKPCIMAGSRVGDTILDPFAGSGTTGMVSLELGRKAILIELNPKYVELIKQRCNVTPGLALA